ncbi:heme A synthase [Corticibacter populi]|uniref:Heme A synthase n=1 Tax=Corticibacter populi TaxID=1550736 RepID=A0A3M6QRV4_9BURK|nr:COX15/CtaA family protein [Corticibacter populi]RMX05774.1 heme A synthase [Corticibacter populi]RZS30919.1 cytochrome c oxidase assembly protein subunit 15 [Corticibacter populi]
MNAEVALYDWSPLLNMLLVGGLIALVPLAWVWRRNRQRGTRGLLQALTVLTLFLTFDLVLFGAFTRLTDSGLGCPDWPGCYGSASPIGARAHISAAQEAVPMGPVTHSKAWIEMIHRYLATTVGALIVVLTVAAWWYWRRRRRIAEAYAWQVAPPNAGKLMPGGWPATPSPLWPTLTLFWVCLQGAFGAWTVTMKLFPAIVTLHLFGGIVLLMLLCLQAVQWRHCNERLTPLGVPAGLKRLMAVACVALLAQIALGGWVSTNYAVLACSTFPDCNGAWWPEMHFAQGFEIWRALGYQGNGRPLDFPALVAIHYTHRLFAVLVTLLLGLLIAQLFQRGQELRRAARWLLALLALQLLTGLSNVVLGWPLLAAVLHTGGAAALALVMTWLLARTRGNTRHAVSTPLFTASNWAHQVDTTAVRERSYD